MGELKGTRGTIAALMNPIPEGARTSGEWLRGVGPESDLRHEILARDWSPTPLGDLGSWPENLRLATASC